MCLALWFLQPWLAFAAAPIGAAVVLVHLLRPGRHKPVRWAAMQFLLAAVAESRQRLRLERWLLLLLRTAMLVLLALMLARPIQQGVGSLFADRDGSALLIIADNGLAMQAPSTLPPHTLMEEAIEAATPIVHAWQGQIAVMPALGDGKPQWLSRSDGAESTLAQLPATAGRADWSALLARAKTLLPESAIAAQRRTVLLLTSLTRGNWPDIDRLAQPLTDLAGTVGRVILVDLQPARRDNHAVIELAVEPTFAGRDLPARAVATIVNYADTSAEGLKIVWGVDGREVRQDEAGSIPANSPKRFTADLPAFGAGPHNIAVHLAGPADALKADDHRWASLSMPQSLRIVLVEPDLAAPAASRASLFVAAALQSAVQQSSVPIRIDTVSPGELSSALFEPADAILLCDAGGLTAGDWQQVAEQSQRGCGLLAWSGPRSASQRYAANPHDLLAALPQSADPARDGQDWTVKLAEPVHPAFLDLVQESAATGGASLGSIRQLLKIRLPADAQVLARTAAGDPLVILRRTGRARTVLVATSPDLAWNNMPSRPSFPAFVLGLLREVLAAAGDDLQVTCGEPIRLPMTTAASTDGGRWIKPDGSVEAAQISLEDGRRDVVLPLAAMPGTYQLETTAGSRTIFASADPQAGDLSALPQADRRRLAQHRLTIVPSSDVYGALAAGASDDWTGPLAYALLAILLTELLLTGWFTRARHA
jgi:hypothetical protein